MATTVQLPPSPNAALLASGQEGNIHLSRRLVVGLPPPLRLCRQSLSRSLPPAFLLSSPSHVVINDFFFNKNPDRRSQARPAFNYLCRRPTRNGNYTLQLPWPRAGRDPRREGRERGTLGCCLGRGGRREVIPRALLRTHSKAHVSRCCVAGAAARFALGPARLRRSSPASRQTPPSLRRGGEKDPAGLLFGYEGVKEVVCKSRGGSGTGMVVREGRRVGGRNEPMD